MRSLSVELLTLAEIDRAFPLIAATLPDIHPDEWHSFAARLIGNRGTGTCGILAAQAEGGYLTGLCVYHQIDSIALGRSLLAESFVALDLIDPAVVIDALADALKMTAARQGCARVRAWAPSRRGGLIGHLKASGFVEEGIALNFLCEQPAVPFS